MKYKYLWAILVVYVSALLMSNWYDARFIDIFGIQTDAGTLIFPITFLCSDIITEVYGYKQTRQAIWVAFALNIAYLIFGWIIIHLPSPDFAAANNLAFDKLLEMSTWIVVASTVSYFCGEVINAMIVAKLKIYMQGRFMAVRFFFSTFVASFFDSLLFTFIAFAHELAFNDLMRVALTMWGIKVLVEFIGLPISTTISKRLKKIEQTDIYDIDTDFNVFSKKTNYQDSNNFYKKTN